MTCFRVFISILLFFIACNTSNLNENDIILDSDSKSCDYRASLNYTFAASVLLFCRGKLFSNSIRLVDYNKITRISVKFNCDFRFQLDSFGWPTLNSTTQQLILLTFESNSRNEWKWAEFFVRCSWCLNQRLATRSTQLIQRIEAVKIVIVAETSCSWLRILSKVRLKVGTANVRLIVLINTAKERSIVVVASRCRLSENLWTFTDGHALGTPRTHQSIGGILSSVVARLTIFCLEILWFNDYMFCDDERCGLFKMSYVYTFTPESDRYVTIAINSEYVNTENDHDQIILYFHFHFFFCCFFIYTFFTVYQFMMWCAHSRLALRYVSYVSRRQMTELSVSLHSGKMFNRKKSNCCAWWLQFDIENIPTDHNDCWWITDKLTPTDNEKCFWSESLQQ